MKNKIVGFLLTFIVAVVAIAVVERVPAVKKIVKGE